MHKHFSACQDTEQSRTINRLKNDLSEAYVAIIDLMPEDIHGILISYRSCMNRLESRRWIDEACDQIIELAKILPPYNAYSHRACCPMCGAGNDQFYVSGFTVPEGLRRHLIGWGNVRECGVMRAARKLATEYWDRQFSAREIEENTEKGKLMAKRRLSETLYRIKPNGAPELLDEIYFDLPRKQAEMDFAEQRLINLGFHVALEENVKSYTREYEDVVVFADPRAANVVRFYVYPKQNGKGKRLHSYNNFFLRDNWKNDITGKYESRLAEAQITLHR